MGTSATEVERLIQAARLHLAHGELHEAAGRATEAIRLDGKQAAAYLVRAEAHRRLKRSERALADLAVAIRLDPHQPGPFVVRAEILKRRCLLDQAIADATSALMLDPRNAAAYAIRAQCRYAIGDQEGAREDVQEMLLIDPTRPVPDLRGGAVSDPSSATAADDEHFWKRAAGREDERALFADGKPVDRTYRSRQVVGDEEAPEALGVASGYKPEVIARPIPRTRSHRGRHDRHAPRALIILGGAALFGMGLLWARRGQPTDRAPEKIEAGGPTAGDAGPTSRPDPAVPNRAPATLTLVPPPVREPNAPTGLGGGAPPPSGARSPEGTGLGGWQATAPVEVMNWVSQDGVLTYAAQGPSLMTTKKYGDFELRLEFLLPPKCNSGVYLRGRYEVQLIDPAFFPDGYLSPHAGNHGAIWGLIAPRQVVFSGPNRWNTLDVRMVGRNVSVRLNGVLVVDNKRVDRPTAGALDSNEGEPGPIVLQGLAVTGSKFRNISIIPLPAVTTTGGRPGSGPTSPAVLAPARREDAQTTPPLAGNAPEAATAVTEIVSLTELNTARRDFCPWLSPDGLTIYWVTDTPSDPEGEVWSARRKAPGSLFAEKRTVGYGRHVAVSADGLTMFLVARRADGRPGSSIQVARRPSTGEAFGRPQEIPELRPVESPRNLFLSADGGTLVFCDGPFTPAGFRLMVTTRVSPDARWGRPRPVPVAPGRGVQGLMTGPYLFADGRMLLCALEQPSDRPVGRFMACSRYTPDEPFSRPVFLALP